MTKLLAFTLFLSLYSVSFGQNLSARQVSNLFYNAGCDKSKTDQCRGGITTQTFNKSEIRRLPRGLQNRLYQLAHDQAQIWGDTILEGDYAAEGKVRLDMVILIQSQSRIVGYGIRYSERAWYTGDCSYSYDDPMSLKTCPEGRIQERSFVSTDLSEAEVDKNQFADFVTHD